jgi:hypothetical protein
MNDVQLLEGYELKQLLRRVGHLYNRLVGTFGRPVRPHKLFETLLHAYPEVDADALMARLESLVADHGPALVSVIEDHSEGSADYVESRDWLYDGPEVLLVADLARCYPSRLRAIAVGSDYSFLLDTMAGELAGS